MLITDSIKEWDSQIRLFSRYFLAHIRVPEKVKFSLLDVGCGTGSGLAEIKKLAPQADLSGCDLEDLHVALARQLNAANARFFKSDIRSIFASFDCIYASNILEHIPEWRDCITHLCSLAPHVFVLVPYRENLADKIRSGIENVDHLNSYDRNSFSFLRDESRSVTVRVIRTPHAWGYPILRELRKKVGLRLRNEKYSIKRELLVLIRTARRAHETQHELAFGFRNRWISQIRSALVTARYSWTR